jgi:hypothetical protein
MLSALVYVSEAIEWMVVYVRTDINHSDEDTTQEGENKTDLGFPLYSEAGDDGEREVEDGKVGQDVYRRRREEEGDEVEALPLFVPGPSSR